MARPPKRESGLGPIRGGETPVNKIAPGGPKGETPPPKVRPPIEKKA